jgi:CTP synthase (UTP-ammonia lyase)
LRFTGFDFAGEIRAAELPAHPFYFGTLFQPERSALRGAEHPLIQAFVRAVAGNNP